MHTPSLAYWATVTGIYLTLTDSMYVLSVLVNASSRTFKKKVYFIRRLEVWYIMPLKLKSQITNLCLIL